MPLSKAQLAVRAKKIKLLAMDVDGVLTNGDILILESGEEVKVFNAKDRLALALLREGKLGLKVAWITGRASRAVELSAEDLGVSYLVQKCANKKAALEKILNENNLKFHEAAYIGDDIIDLPVMKAVGLAACPADAVTDVKKVSHYVSKIAGGRGSVRDVLEMILRTQKKWDGLLSHFSH